MKFEECPCFSCHLACNDFNCERCRSYGDCSACKFSDPEFIAVAPSECTYLPDVENND